MRSISRPPLVLATLVLALAACGPVKIDVGDVNLGGSPKPSTSPSPGASGAPGSPKPSSATSSSPGASPDITATPTPALPGATPTPDTTNATATPFFIDPGATSTPAVTETPDVITTPAPNATPQPVASRGPYGPSGDSSSLTLSPTNGTFVPTAVGANSKGQAWLGFGTVNNTSSGTQTPSELRLVDAKGDMLSTLALTGPVVAIQVDRFDNAWVLYVGNPKGSTVAALSLAKVSPQGKLLSSLSLGGNYSSINVGGNPLQIDGHNVVWVTATSSNSVYKVSSNNGLLTTYTLQGNSPQVAIADNVGLASWVGLGGIGGVAKLGAAGTLPSISKLPDVGQVQQLQVDTTGRLWAFGLAGGTNQTTPGVNGSSYVDIFNSPSGQNVATFSLGYFIRGAQADPNGDMWVLGSTASGGGSATQLDAKGNAVQSFPLGDYPAAFSFGGDGSIWAASSYKGTVTRVGP